LVGPKPSDAHEGRSRKIFRNLAGGRRACSLRPDQTLQPL
jgi:hypothetical protein